jgi:hypothetical protein
MVGLNSGWVWGLVGRFDLCMGCTVHAATDVAVANRGYG